MSPAAARATRLSCRLFVHQLYVKSSTFLLGINAVSAVRGACPAGCCRKRPARQFSGRSFATKSLTPCIPLIGVIAIGLSPFVRLCCDLLPHESVTVKRSEERRVGK